MTRASRRIAVLGDLHYEAPEDGDYRAARRQLVDQRPDRVIQLGDQGGYSHCGTWRSFLEGREFLAGFDRPFRTLLGNHDMEGPEYGSDAQAVAAWCEAFGFERPYDTVDLGPALGVCLSTTRFRANAGCCHEVYLDEPQVDWLRATLSANRNRPTFVFSHAPIVGSGLRVLQNIHLKCPNAWLNHTDRPERFIRLVRENPQVKLWFSAHNHLGHDYPDSISRVGDCAFVHTGVIGSVTRDDRHHSRLVDFDVRGFTLGTLDHDSGNRVENLRVDYSSGVWERLSDSTADDGPTHFGPPPFPRQKDRWQVDRSVFALNRGMLVEFDRDLQAPLGVVAERLTSDQVEVSEGELRIVGHLGQETLRPRADGRYLRVFEPNPRLARRSA